MDVTRTATSIIAQEQPYGTQVGRAGASGAFTPSLQDAKAIKAGKDFESVLLGSWLQQAEQSFATVPGGDGQESEDAGKDQFQGIAMQALAGSLTSSGGIGIARMITHSLRTQQGSTQIAAAPTPHSSAAIAPMVK